MRFSVAAFVSVPVLALLVQQATASPFVNHPSGGQGISLGAKRAASSMSTNAAVPPTSLEAFPSGYFDEAVYGIAESILALADVNLEDIGCTSARETEVELAAVQVEFKDGLFTDLEVYGNSTCDNIRSLFEAIIADGVATEIANDAVTLIKRTNDSAVCITFTLEAQGKNTTVMTALAEVATNLSLGVKTPQQIYKDVSPCIPN